MQSCAGAMRKVCSLVARELSGTNCSRAGGLRRVHALLKRLARIDLSPFFLGLTFDTYNIAFARLYFVFDIAQLLSSVAGLLRNKFGDVCERYPSKGREVREDSKPFRRRIVPETLQRR